MLLEIKRNQAPPGALCLRMVRFLAYKRRLFFDKPITCHLKRLPKQARNATQKSQPICRGQLRACLLYHWYDGSFVVSLSVVVDQLLRVTAACPFPCFSYVIFSDWLSTYYWPVGSKQTLTPWRREENTLPPFTCRIFGEWLFTIT